MKTTTLETKVHDFLAQKRIAVAGVSRDNSHHPVGDLIYQRLKRTGHCRNTSVSPPSTALSRSQLHSSQRGGQFDRQADTSRPGNAARASI